MMRITFLCGSLELGRDGVGDYVRRLSLDLLRHGHLVSLISINDRHISAVITEGGQPDDGLLPILRIPAGLDKAEGTQLIKERIDQFNPDWLSLQYVPFSFDPKGLIFGLAKKLKGIGKGRKWHIMFHELWIGMTVESNTKELIWGGLQRYLAGNLIKALQPAVVHTHTDLYKKQLEKLGAKVTLLPLFSNILVSHPGVIKEKINRDIVIDKKMDLVIFGGIHIGTPIHEFAQEVADYASRQQIEINLVIIGRAGKEQENWVREWEAAGLNVTQLGEHPAEKVSELLEKAVFGVFTTPIALVEKSGSVSAMRDHGIHLLCVSRPWTPKIKLAENPYHIMEYKKGNLESFFSTKPDFSYVPTLSALSEQFIDNLLIIN
ncbi:hypothetical protein [Pedobacter sp. L105]|uniref:hypothetical protein n=1 Tax=Pedobacter sp. L105 TaxID=1641871 RepID=UPI00131BAB42|nr:hypothetical protein [Pedobacter sp. L105]